MAYFILENPVGPKRVKADFMPFQGFNESWFQGKHFVRLPPSPIELTWDPDHEHGIRVAYYDASPPVLMRKDLLQAMRGAGVNNLDAYPAVIHSNKPDVPDCHDYEAVNIIGAIAAVNMDESEVADEGSGMINMAFDSIVIDEEKAKNSLLFRLGESVTTVVIHEQVVSHLKSCGGFGLTFTPPEDYCDV